MKKCPILKLTIFGLFFLKHIVDLPQDRNYEALSED